MFYYQLFNIQITVFCPPTCDTCSSWRQQFINQTYYIILIRKAIIMATYDAELIIEVKSSMENFCKTFFQRAMPLHTKRRLWVLFIVLDMVRSDTIQIRCFFMPFRSTIRSPFTPCYQVSYLLSTSHLCYWISCRPFSRWAPDTLNWTAL